MSEEYRGARLRFDVVAIPADGTLTIAAPPRDEIVAVLVSGAVEWCGVRSARASMFGERASALYVPPGTSVDVVASSAAELAVVTTVDGDCEPVPGGTAAVVTPDDVVVHRRGQPGWEREVHDIVVDAVPAQRLLVGETFNAPGQWSSFPPHKHDGRDGEPALEEVYWFCFDDPNGFGVQGLYDRDGNERAVFLRDRTVVGIPGGFHPVCAAPGYRLAYLWAIAPYAGTPRRLAMYEDPAHTWLHEVPAGRPRQDSNLRPRH